MERYDFGLDRSSTTYSVSNHPDRQAGGFESVWISPDSRSDSVFD